MHIISRSYKMDKKYWISHKGIIKNEFKYSFRNINKIIIRNSIISEKWRENGNENNFGSNGSNGSSL